MAFRAQFLPLVFVMMLCSVVLQTASECKTGYGCSYAKAAASSSLEVLYGWKAKEMGHEKTSSSTGGGKSMVGWELREAPLGPDPLHHHGGSPKKPRTP
ncbi:unnamed protein product [Ilex paraguariensis]|uniref:Uncharacterized protein n=1 Tax=Ilex paraguariensis TaxID=185542 RepID=A0ABC8UUD0_9AQUA